MALNNQEKKLLVALLESSNLHSKQSLFQKRANKNLNSPTIQHHINALANALQSISKYEPMELSSIGLRGGKLFKKTNKFNTSSKTPLLSVNLRVANIKVNTAFSEKVSLDKDIDGKIKFVNTCSIDDFKGVEFDAEKLILSGKSELVGDHSFKLYGVLPLANGEDVKVIATLKITFVPDPKSLWKNIPSDDTARFHKPDFFDAYCENNNVLLMGSSVRGRSHAHKGIHRDDDFRLFCDDTSEWSVSCVADGAGSCKYSRQGAFSASLHATNTLKESLNGHYGIALEQACNDFHLNKNENTQKQLFATYQHTMVKAVFEAAKAIHDCVDPEKGDRVKDFSTTLILAAHKKVADGYLVVSFWIGDGGIVIYDKDNQVTLMGEPDSGEFAGQTRFLDKNIFEGGSVYSRVKMEKVESMSALILATDGITDAWFETEKQLSSLLHWNKLWQEVEPYLLNEDRSEGLKGLTKWMDFWSKGNHDDRTISITMVKE